MVNQMPVAGGGVRWGTGLFRVNALAHLKAGSRVPGSRFRDSFGGMGSGLLVSRMSYV